MSAARHHPLQCCCLGSPSQVHRLALWLCTAMAKRVVAVSQLANKRAKVKQQFHQLASVEKAVKESEDLSSIVAELMRCPAKVGPCKLAVMGNFFLDVQEDEPDEVFHSTYIYLNRCPKMHIESLLQAMQKQKFDVAAIKLLKTGDKDVIFKLFHMFTCSDSKDKFPSHNKNVFNQVVLDRVVDDKLQKLIEDLQSDESGNIDWLTCGVYELQPPYDVSLSASQHQFTHVLCKPLMRKAMP